jgi:TonB family protein
MLLLRALAFAALLPAAGSTLTCGRLSVALQPEITQNQRLLVWANAVSLAARTEARRRLDPGADGRADAAQLERLLGRFHLDRGDLAEILAEGAKRGWRESAACTRPALPLRGHALALAPELLHPPLRAAYTEAACRRRIEGTAILDTVIDAAGHVQEADVVRGLAPDLDRQAVAAVRATPWWPALLCGRPVAVHFTVVVPFRLPPGCR